MRAWHSHQSAHIKAFIYLTVQNLKPHCSQSPRPVPSLLCPLGQWGVGDLSSIPGAFSCVIWEKLLNHSVPLFPYRKNGLDDNSTYLKELLSPLKELTYVKYAVLCPVSDIK